MTKENFLCAEKRVEKVNKIIYTRNFSSKAIGYFLALIVFVRIVIFTWSIGMLLIGMLFNFCRSVSCDVFRSLRHMVYRLSVL